LASSGGAPRLIDRVAHVGRAVRHAEGSASLDAACSSDTIDGDDRMSKMSGAACVTGVGALLDLDERHDHLGVSLFLAERSGSTRYP
jgi:hypothetical protein